MLWHSFWRKCTPYSVLRHFCPIQWSFCMYTKFSGWKSHRKTICVWIFVLSEKFNDLSNCGLCCPCNQLDWENSSRIPGGLGRWDPHISDLGGSGTRLDASDLGSSWGPILELSQNHGSFLMGHPSKKGWVGSAPIYGNLSIDFILACLHRPFRICWKLGISSSRNSRKWKVHLRQQRWRHSDPNQELFLCCWFHWSYPIGILRCTYFMLFVDVDGFWLPVPSDVVPSNDSSNCSHLMAINRLPSNDLKMWGFHQRSQNL